VMNIVACRAVAVQRAQDGPFLGSGLVNTFPQQQAGSQQKSCVFCVVCAEML
jgi:hypothetical protein